jgi:hypothetical protein
MGQTKNKQLEAKLKMDETFAMAKPSREILEELAVR